VQDSGWQSDSQNSRGIGRNFVVQSNAVAKKATIDRHRAAFDLWRFIHETLEDVVIRDRNHKGSFERSLDLLFIQAFKSHGSLYSLCVLGHCEDAATIARRILEIALQVGYLDSEELERENRGKRYLAYFWHLTKGILANDSLTAESRQRWQQLYDQNKTWLQFNKHGKPLPNWSGLNFAALASKLNMQQTYDVDYRFLSNAAHSSAAGAMLSVVEGTLQIADDTFVSPILVYGTRYMLAVTEVWNAHFKLIEDSKLEEFRKQVLNFDFKAANVASKNSR
jgi:hypothetical protein